MLFSGSLVALITPFNKRGKLDEKALEALVEWHIQEKTDGIVCCGTTGEACTLTRKERKKITEICVQTASGRIPIIAGTGTCSTNETRILTEDAKKAGAAGCLVVTPYYNKPTQLGCFEHFRAIAKVDLPIIVYHNPGRAVFRFEIETLQRFEEIPQIVAIKDSSHDLDFVQKIKSSTKLPILSGEDDITYEILELGGVGSISVIGNIIPSSWRKMIHQKSKPLAKRYLPLCQANFFETNPQCVKYLLAQMGKCLPVFRLPLTNPSLLTQKRLDETLFKFVLPHYVKNELRTNKSFQEK